MSSRRAHMFKTSHGEHIVSVRDRCKKYHEDHIGIYHTSNVFVIEISDLQLGTNTNYRHIK